MVGLPRWVGLAGQIVIENAMGQNVVPSHAREHFSLSKAFELITVSQLRFAMLRAFLRIVSSQLIDRRMSVTPAGNTT
jgi:hypothetical protein